MKFENVEYRAKVHFSVIQLKGETNIWYGLNKCKYSNCKSEILNLAFSLAITIIKNITNKGLKYLVLSLYHILL